MVASLEFAVASQADCVPAMMLEGQFYREAGVAFGERSAVSLLQRDTGE